MLFDWGWSELMLIGVVALVVIGPKDLPKALRVAGYWVRKARQLSREFQSSVDQMIREAELDEVRQDLKKATEFDLDKEFRQTVDPTGSLAESLKPPELPDFSSAPAPPAADEEKRIEAPVEPAAGGSVPPNGREMPETAPHSSPLPAAGEREESAQREGEGRPAAETGDIGMTIPGKGS